MSLLARVKTGRVSRPKYLLVYGKDGIGKTSLVADAPDVFLVCSEQGADEFDCARFHPQSWDDVMDVCKELRSSRTNPYKTLAVDTLDWLEPLLWKSVAESCGKESIEDIGYGRGYTYALEEWRKLNLEFQALRASGMHVVLLAHSKIEKFTDPKNQQHTYDRFVLKLHKGAADFWREAVDAVLFADYEVHRAEDAKTKRISIIDGNRRVLYTQWSAGYDAKNRYGLPVKIPLAWPRPWAGLMAAIDKQSTEGSAALIAKIKEGIRALRDEALAEKVKASLDKAGHDMRQLTTIGSRLEEILNSQPEAETPIVEEIPNGN